MSALYRERQKGTNCWMELSEGFYMLPMTSASLFVCVEITAGGNTKGHTSIFGSSLLADSEFNTIICIRTHFKLHRTKSKMYASVFNVDVYMYVILLTMCE